MANYATLISAIQEVIAANGNNEITGPILQQTLVSIVNSLGAGYQYLGIATPSTNPGTPDQRVFYIAGPGVYSNFGPTTIGGNQIGVFKYDSSWGVELLSFPIADGSVTTQKLADESVTIDKLAQSVVNLINAIIVGDTQNSDLEFVDEIGNVLVMFRNGHIKTKYFDSENIELDVLIRPNIYSDLDISDEQDNAIVRFQNGHIKTKYFDSEKIKSFSIEKFSGKKIAILGDSISTFSGWLPSSVPGYTGANYVTYYPHGSLANVTQTWWYKVAQKLGLNPETDINNCSWSGSCVTTTFSGINSDSTINAAPGCSTRRITDLSIRGYNPDIVLVFIGCNDWSIDTPLGTWKTSDAIPQEGAISTFRDAYALMLNKIHVAYPSAKIFCLTNLDDLYRDRTPGWPSNNRNNISTYEWNQNVVEIANAFGCETIDVHNCGINYVNLLSYVVDTGLHPNESGMDLIANKVASDLILKF